MIELESLHDLHETFFCLGDYHGASLEVVTGPRRPTRLLLAVRGPRGIDDATLLEGLRHIVEGQARYFGRSHPAPLQMFAVHFFTDDPPDVPGFNTKARGHDTVVGFIPAERPPGPAAASSRLPLGT